MNVLELTISEAMPVVESLMQIPQVVVPFLSGGPGLGKSSIIEQLAKKMFARHALGADKCDGCKLGTGDPTKHARGCAGHHQKTYCVLCQKATQRRQEVVPHVKLIDCRLATMDPVEVKGLNYPGEDGRTLYGTPDFFPLDNDEYSILFFDEFTCAPGAVQNTALSIILDRKIHQNPLSANCVMVAAGNRDKDGGYTARMAGPMANRLAHIDLRLDVDDFVAYGIQAGFRPEVMGAVRTYPDQFMNEFDKAQKAQPTPRTLEFLSRVLDQNPNASDAQIRALAGPIIGPGPANVFMAFLAEFVHIQPDDIILRGTMPEIPASEVSRQYAASASVAHYLRNHLEAVDGADKDPKKKARVKNFYTFLRLLPIELQVKTVRDLNLAQNAKLLLNLHVGDPESFKSIMARVTSALAPDAK